MLLLFLVSLLPVLGLALPEDFLEMTYFREEHIASSSSQFPLGPEVLSPEMVGDQLIWFGFECFEIQKVDCGCLSTLMDICAQFDFVQGGGCDGVSDSKTFHAEIVADGRFERNFFKRGYA